MRRDSLNFFEIGEAIILFEMRILIDLNCIKHIYVDINTIYGSSISIRPEVNLATLDNKREILETLFSECNSYIVVNYCLPICNIY